jgi:hypothetical protein
MEEIWKPINGYEDKYLISNLGNVKSLYRWNGKAFYKREYLLNKYVNKHNGYVYICLTKNNKIKNVRLHRLVAKTFIHNPKNLPQVNHIDGNKLNNKVDNLEWCTCKENIIHAYNIGLSENKNKIKVKQYDINGKLLNEYKSLSEASNKTGINIQKISLCINNKYKYRNKNEKYIWKKG